jgi:hypothetical protein
VVYVSSARELVISNPSALTIIVNDHHLNITQRLIPMTLPLIMKKNDEEDDVPDQLCDDPEYDDDLGRGGVWGNVLGEPVGL